ncbi:MAG TPA: DUF1186 domain-containing protein [Acetobacteraceae bacterium]|jgi:hypothetical protein
MGVTPMTIDDVLREFGSYEHKLPRDAMQWALDNWPEAAPRFLQLLKHYADGSDRSEATQGTVFLALHLMAEQRETGGFGDLCRILQQPELREDLLGDGITTTLSQILICTFDGDVAALHAAIEAVDADEFVRNAAILAMAWLVRVGRIPRTDAHDYLRGLFATMQPQRECYIWFGWTECVSLLGFADLATCVRQLFDRGFVDPTIMSYHHFEEDLKQTLDDPESMASFADHHLEPLGSAIQVLSGWYSFSERYAIDEAQRLEREAARARQQQQSVAEQNPWRNVGRNDACPCGSGKKFKKCCLTLVQTEGRIAERVHAG